MGMPCARVGDMHVCPAVCPGPVPHVGGPIQLGEFTVMVAGMPCARIGDMAVCACMPDTIAAGSPTVMVGGMPCARLGDSCAHGGTIVVGAPTVMVG
ncbi:MAG: PAAR domain-containing protein [Saprospiraceae bacterium]|nr:PAAR domain-containing protein [Saprospiraceae bacterium]